MKRLSDEAIAEKLSGLTGWRRTGEAIAKTYRFETFLGGIAFVNRVAEIAEEIDHHPDITVRYRRVAFSVTTYSAGGLTVLDFELAKRIDGAYESRAE
ncbi:MAG: 4a-hydroxytetrahydrobiopterin dehydratase [Candidatus Tectimicrobiota bacterium]